MSIRSLLTGAIVATLTLSSAASWAQQNHDKRGGRAVIIEQDHRGISDGRRSQGDKDRHSHQRDWHHDKRAKRAHERFHRQEERAERRQERRERLWQARERRYEHQSRSDRGHSRSHGSSFYYSARGPDFRRGQYMPSSMRNPQYVVRDHRRHRLNSPPRGHQWVQVGGDYVLVAIATGIIANIVLNR